MEISPAKLTLIVAGSIVVGIALTIIGGTVWMYSMLSTGRSVSLGGEEKPKVVASASLDSPALAFLDSNNMTWGNTPSHGLPELITGEAKVAGSAKVDGKPLAGLRLRLVLNRKAMSAWTVTDAAGRYEIGVPAGKYVVNGYEFDQSVADKLLAGKIIRPGCLWTRCADDMPSEASPAKPATGIHFEFIDPVVLETPAGELTIGPELIARWKPYRGAARYRVSLSEVPPRYAGGSSKSVFDWRTRPEVTATSLDLIKAGLVPKPGQDYSIGVEALDENGTVMSETPSRLMQGQFRLVKAP